MGTDKPPPTQDMPTCVCAHTHIDTHTHTYRVLVSALWQSTAQGQGRGHTDKLRAVRASKDSHSRSPLVAAPPAPQPQPPHRQISLVWLVQLLPPPSTPCRLYSASTHRALCLNVHQILQTPCRKPWDGGPVLLRRSSPSSTAYPKLSTSAHLVPTSLQTLLHPLRALCYPRTFAWAPPPPRILPTALDMSVTCSFKCQLRYGEILSRETMMAFFFLLVFCTQTSSQSFYTFGSRVGSVGCLGR